MITLLTDFGISDPYVGMMKGVILSINPFTRIIDITHHIPPQDIEAAAYLIDSSYPYFPESTIHIIVVDPGVGSNRPILAVKINTCFFLAPDNGVLSLILNHEKSDIVTIENSEYFLRPVSQTFHGRDIMAPVAAHLSLGVDMNKLGDPAVKEKIVDLHLKAPTFSAQGELEGKVISVDRFGNLITNIKKHMILEKFGTETIKHLHVKISNHHITKISSFYQDNESDALLAIIGSLGFLEISVNGGNASKACNAGRGTSVRVMSSSI